EHSCNVALSDSASSRAVRQRTPVRRILVAQDRKETESNPFHGRLEAQGRSSFSLPRGSWADARRRGGRVRCGWRLWLDLRLPTFTLAHAQPGVSSELRSRGGSTPRTGYDLASTDGVQALRPRSIAESGDCADRNRHGRGHRRHAVLQW